MQANMESKLSAGFINKAEWMDLINGWLFSIFPSTRFLNNNTTGKGPCPVKLEIPSASYIHPVPRDPPVVFFLALIVETVLLCRVQNPAVTDDRVPENYALRKWLQHL